MSFFIYNDEFFPEDSPVIKPGNRALKYGDGLFETLKINNGIIQLYNYHLDRLFYGMKILQFEVTRHFTADHLANKISELSKKNQHDPFARVRLMMFRGDGSLYDDENNFANYIIETWSLEQSPELNSKGLLLDIYPDARKSCDVFGNIKSNNFLPYTMAMFHAKKINVDDCVILNQHDRICDTSIANIFIIKKAIIYTPPLNEGCIAGVMRRFIIEKLGNSEFKIVEKTISVEDVKNSDEVFLTNSIRGIRWVKQFYDIEYNNKIVMQLHGFIQAELKKKN